MCVAAPESYTPPTMAGAEQGRKPATALAIGGADPSGGAGLATDRLTFGASGVWGRLVVTAVTAQGDDGLRGSWPVPVEALRAQLDAALEGDAVAAVKIGMLPTADAVRAVVAALAPTALPAVLDPVLRTTSGGDLIDAEGCEALVAELWPRAALVTPNRPEAARVLATSERSIAADPSGAAAELARRHAAAVLLKGGHAEGPDCVDVYADGRTTFELSTPRVPTANLRGTGCALAAAIAAQLALGLALADAVRAAKRWFDDTLRDGAALDFGPGPGPLPVLGERLRAQPGGQGRSLRT